MHDNNNDTTQQFTFSSSFDIIVRHSLVCTTGTTTTQFSVETTKTQNYHLRGHCDAAKWPSFLRVCVSDSIGMRQWDILSFYYYANVYTLNDLIKKKKEFADFEGIVLCGFCSAVRAIQYTQFSIHSAVQRILVISQYCCSKCTRRDWERLK